MDRREAADTRQGMIAEMVNEGLRPSEIAARLGVSADAVSSMLSRMRAAGTAVPMGRRGPARKARVG